MTKQEIQKDIIYELIENDCKIMAGIACLLLKLSLFVTILSYIFFVF